MTSIFFHNMSFDVRVSIKKEWVKQMQPFPMKCLSNRNKVLKLGVTKKKPHHKKTTFARNVHQINSNHMELKSNLITLFAARTVWSAHCIPIFIEYFLCYFNFRPLIRLVGVMQLIAFALSVMQISREEISEKSGKTHILRAKNSRTRAALQ